MRPPFLNLRRLIVAGANLLEAEGRALRVSVVKLGLSLGGVVAGLMVAALYFGLAPEIGRAWSLLACGVVCALAAVGITRLAVGLAR